MTVPLNPKWDWQTSAGESFNLGRDSYLVMSLDNGYSYFELETAKDVNFNIEWANTEVTTRYNAIDRAWRPVNRSFTITAEALFDSEDGYMGDVMRSAVRGDAVLVGAFTDNGTGPLIWANINMQTRMSFNEVVSLSLNFNTIEFVWFFYHTGQALHPLTRLVNPRDYETRMYWKDTSDAPVETNNSVETPTNTEEPETAGETNGN